MAKKSFSTKKNLKSLLSKSEANLQDSAGNDASGGDGGKTLKLFKWKKKKKTEPEAGKAEDKTVSQAEFDGAKTGVSSPNGGDQKKKLTLFSTAPRSKKGVLSSSETDLRSPKKFGKFSLIWKKKSNKRADNISPIATLPDAPQNLEEEDLKRNVEDPIDLTHDPGNSLERRVRFECSELEPPGPQDTLSPPLGPPDQPKLHEEVPDSPDVQDRGVTQDLAPSAPDAVKQTSEVAPLHVDREEGQEVQVNCADEPAPLPSAEEGALVPSASAAYAALIRAVTLRGSLPEPQPAVHPRSVYLTPDTYLSRPGTDLPHADTSHLKNDVSEMAIPTSALSEPGTSNTDLYIPKTELSDTPISNSDISVAVVKETDTSLLNSDLSETAGAISKTSLLSADLPETVALPNTDTSVPKTVGCDTVVPDADTPLPHTDLSDSTALNTDTTSPKFEVLDTDIPGTDTSPKSADVSGTVAPSTTTSLSNSDFSDTIDLITDTPLPKSVIFDSSPPRHEISSIAAPDTDLSNTGIPKTDTSIPLSDPSDTLTDLTDTTAPKTDASDTTTPNTDTSDSTTPNTDTSDSTTPNTDTSPEIEVPDTDVSGNDTSLKNTEFSESALPNTDLFSAGTPLTNISPVYTDLTDALSCDIDSILPKTEISNTAAVDLGIPNSDPSDSTAPNTDTPIPNTDPCDSTAPNTDTPIPNTDPSDPFDSTTPKTDTSIPNTDPSDSNAPNTDTLIPNTDPSDSNAPNTDSSIPLIDTSDSTPPNTETSDSTTPNTDTSITLIDPSKSTASNADPSIPNTDTSDSTTSDYTTPYTDTSDSTTSDYTTANSDTSGSTTPSIDTSSPTFEVPDTDLSNTDTSLKSADVSDTVALSTTTSLSNSDLSDTLDLTTDTPLPNTDTALPHTDTFDSSVPNTNLTDTTAPNADTSPNIEVPDTDVPSPDISLKSADVSDTVALSTTTSLSNSDLSDTLDLTTDTPLPNTDTALPHTDTFDSSVPNTNLADTTAPNADTSPNIEVPDTDVPSPDISLKSADVSDTVALSTTTSLSNSDLSDTLDLTTDTPLPNTDTALPHTDTFDSSVPNTNLTDTTAPNADTSPNIEVPDTDVPSPDISLKSADVSDTVALSTTTSLSNSDLSDTLDLTTDTPLPNTDTALPHTDTFDSSVPNTNLADTTAPNADTSPNIEVPDTDVPSPDISLKSADVSDTVALSTTTSLSNSDLSDTLDLTTDTPLPNTDTALPHTDTFDSSVPNTNLADTTAPNADTSPNIEVPDTDVPSPDISLKNSEFSDAHAPNTERSNSVILNTDSYPLNTDLSALPSPGLSFAENLNQLCSSSQDLEGSNPDSPDQDGTIVLTMGFPDTISDKQEAEMQEEEVDRVLAAKEMGRLGDGVGRSSPKPVRRDQPSPEQFRRDPEENGAVNVIKVVPLIQEEDQNGQEEKDVHYQEYKNGGIVEEIREELVQWREEAQIKEELNEERMEEKVKGKGPVIILKLVEVTVEREDEAKMALTKEEEGRRGVQAEDVGVLGQKKRVIREMEEVEQCPQLPATEPDSPVRQERVPQKCEPAPPSPTTEGEGPPLNLRMATEKHPCVLASEEQIPERANYWVRNIHNTRKEVLLTDTATERTHTLTDHTSLAHTLADSVTERAASTRTSTLCDTPVRAEDPLPSLSPVSPGERAGRFLDDLSGPWGTVEACVSPGVQEDPDTMSSGYGVLSTTLSVKPIAARDGKEDGQQRFRKVSLVSSSEDPGEVYSSSPEAVPYDNDRGSAGTEGKLEILSREDRSPPGEVTPCSLPQSTFLSSLNSHYSPAFLDAQYLSSPGTNQEAGLSALSPEEPGSHSNSHTFSERSEVQWSWERELEGWDRAEPTTPPEERVWEGGINSGSDSHWLSDRSLSPTLEDPFSGVFKATRVDLLPSPTSPGINSPHDMDSLVDTLKSMEPPQRQRLSKPPPLSTITSLPPIVEDSPVQPLRAQNGSGGLPQDLGLKRSSPKDMPTPLEMMKRQHAADGPRSLPQRVSAESSIVFRKSSPRGALSPDGSSSPQLNGASSPGPSRLDSSLLFSGYRLENGKPPSSPLLTRASSLPDVAPSVDRMSSAPGHLGAETQLTGPSRYERFSFLMSPPSSLNESPEPPRISRPSGLPHSPLGELGFTHSGLWDIGLGHRPSSPLDLLHSPSTDPHSKLHRSLSVDSALGKVSPQLTPQPEPEKPAAFKYRAFPDAYLTKEKEHGKLNPRPGKMLIFTEPGLSGERIEIRGDVIDATPWDLPETIYIRVVRGGWVLYEKPNFKGEKVALDEGDIELTSPFGSPEEQKKEGEGEEEEKSQPSKKCVIGSLRRAVRDYSVPEISLFPEENAEGKKVIFRDTSEDARIFGFPIKANSIIIKAGLWLVYAHPFMEGVPRVLEVGGYPTPASWGVTKPYVGSLHPLKIGEPKVEKPNEPKLVIFDKPYFSGKSRDVYTHLRDFMTRADMKQTAFMNDAGSIKVIGGCWVGFSKENFQGHQYLLEEGDYHDWRVWGGRDSELRSIRLIRADFAEPMLVMFSQPDEEDEDQEEKSFEVTEAIPDVEPFNFPTSTHSIHVLNGAWIAYSHVDFSGDQYILEKGFYRNCGDWGSTNNRICSIQPILPAPSETPTTRSQVLLYSEPDFQGQCQLCLNNEESLPEQFCTKSCRVLGGSWVLYEGREYSGGLYILPEGDYPNLISMGCPPGCSLRSLKIIPLMFAVPSISLFGLECFEGREVTLDSEVPSLVDEGFNNHVLSVRVNSGCWVVCEHTNYRGRQYLLEPIEIPNWLKFSGLSTIGSMHPVRQKRHFFRIKSQERGHFMSIQGGVEEMKSGRVVVTEQVEGMSDVWFYQDGLIKNKLAPSMCLQVMGEVEPGAKAVLWSDTRQPIQIWTTQASGIIKSLTFPGMVLDIKGGKTYDRNHVIIHRESEERPSQQWDIELL